MILFLFFPVGMMEKVEPLVEHVGEYVYYINNDVELLQIQKFSLGISIYTSGKN